MTVALLWSEDRFLLHIYMSRRVQKELSLVKITPSAIYSKAFAPLPFDPPLCLPCLRLFLLPPEEILTDATPLVSYLTNLDSDGNHSTNRKDVFVMQLNSIQYVKKWLKQIINNYNKYYPKLGWTYQKMLQYKLILQK